LKVNYNRFDLFTLNQGYHINDAIILYDFKL